MRWGIIVISSKSSAAEKPGVVPVAIERIYKICKMPSSHSSPEAAAMKVENKIKDFLRGAGCALGIMLLAFPLKGASPAIAEQKFTADSHFVDVPDFTFNDGKSVPGLKLHYLTLGTPHRDSRGEIDNAVLLLHGSGGEGSNFLIPSFADPLFSPGKPLDAAKYFLIMPDSVGHGKSSKPSDGLRTAFPHYNYPDMVTLQHRIVSDALGVHKLNLILGTSMGCMHTYVWGVTYPDEMRALMNMSCSPFPVAGLNWLARKGGIDAITSDPAYQSGNYTSPPAQSLHTAALIVAITTGGAPYYAAQFPTQAAVDAVMAESYEKMVKVADANDLIYQLGASEGYDAWSSIDRIKVPLLWWDSEDDGVNPPTLPYPQMALKRMKNFRYKLQPASAETRGHLTYLEAKFFETDVQALLERSAKP